MGQQVKNVVRAQSKYGLMGSSAKTGKKIFCGSQEQFLDKIVIWDRTPPQLYIKYSVYVSGRAQGSQIFKQNSIILIHSKVMAFLVILLSPWSPRCPHHPHIVPIIPMSSPCCPCHPHIIPIAPRRSPCGPHGCGLRCLHPMLSPRSPWSPCHPCCPHIIPVSSLSFPHRPHSAQKVPMWSPWLWSLWSPLSPPHVVPMLSPWSPCHPRRPHVIPVSSVLFPHHLEGPHIIPNHPDTHSTHPAPPWGVGGPKSVKMQ